MSKGEDALLLPLRTCAEYPMKSLLENTSFAGFEPAERQAVFLINRMISFCGGGVNKSISSRVERFSRYDSLKICAALVLPDASTLYTLNKPRLPHELGKCRVFVDDPYSKSLDLEAWTSSLMDGLPAGDQFPERASCELSKQLSPANRDRKSRLVYLTECLMVKSIV